MLGPGSTIRTRIALIYGVVFVVLGACLLAVVNLLAGAGTQDRADHIAASAQYVPAEPAGTRAEHGLATRHELFLLRESRRERALSTASVHRLTANVTDAASDQMLFWSVAALLVMAALAVGVGWWTAGRVLRPVHAMTAKARRLSERNLHERIGAGGPDDELKELGDTLDALLGRLQKAFDSQRRFIANASHELRTPLATQRAAIQIGLDEGCSAADLARTKQTLLDNNRRSEQLIEGLLVLARSERGPAAGPGAGGEDQEELDLGTLVADEAAGHGVPVSVTDAGTVRGSRLLLGRLVANLLANAVTYNVPGGTVDVSVEGTTLVVRNTGPVVASGEIPGLFEPFRRGEGRDRMGPGAGLGLSIVRSVAVAHGGSVTALPGGARGGLEVTVELPPAGTEAVPAGG